MRYKNIWMDAVVGKVKQVAANVREIQLLPQTTAVPYSVGSHIDVMIPINDVMEVRSYSLVGDFMEGEPYTIAVKRLKSSKGGSLYMWTLEEGNRIKIAQPVNNFELAYTANDFLLVAGGIGITPIVGMAEILAKKDNVTLKMFYLGAEPDEMPYIDYLKKILGNKLTLHYSDEKGTFDVQSIVDLAGQDTLLYLCGPLPLMNAVRKCWEKSTLPNNHIRFETFGASGLLAPQKFKVHIPRHQKEITVEENESLLNALENSGIDMMSDCLKGECGLCMVEIMEHDGIIDHRDFFLSEAQKKKTKSFAPV